VKQVQPICIANEEQKEAFSIKQTDELCSNKKARKASDSKNLKATKGKIVAILP